MPSLTRAANIMKVVVRSTTQWMDSGTDAHCGDVIFPVVFDNPVVNCGAAAWPALLVVTLY